MLLPRRYRGSSRNAKRRGCPVRGVFPGWLAGRLLVGAFALLSLTSHDPITRLALARFHGGAEASYADEKPNHISGKFYGWTVGAEILVANIAPVSCVMRYIHVLRFLSSSAARFAVASATHAGGGVRWRTSRTVTGLPLQRPPLWTLPQSGQAGVSTMTGGGSMPSASHMRRSRFRDIGLPFRTSDSANFSHVGLVGKLSKRAMLSAVEGEHWRMSLNRSYCQ